MSDQRVQRAIRESESYAQDLLRERASERGVSVLDYANDGMDGSGLAAHIMRLQTLLNEWKSR